MSAGARRRLDESDGDQGGNAVKVDFEGLGPDHKPRPAHRTSLHDFGDDLLVNVAQSLCAMTPANGGGTVVIAASYQQAAQPVLDRQLATGGLRLATMLNAAFP